MNLLIIRLIIFAVIFYAGLKLYRMYREWKIDQEESKDHKFQGGSMVRCAWCQVHLPESEALREKGEWFCCQEHKEKFSEEKRDNE